MKRFPKTILLILSFGLLAMSCNRTPEEKANWVVKKVTKKLDLNDKQKTKLVELKNTILEVRARRQSDKEAMYQDIKKLLGSEQIDEGRVRDLISQRQKMVDEEFPKIFPKLQAFHNSLTPEQKNKAMSLLEKFHEKHRSHSGD